MIFNDRESDAKEGRKVNLCNLFGVDRSLSVLHEQVEAYQQLLQELHIATDSLIALAPGGYLRKACLTI